MKLTSILLVILTVVLIVAGTYCYVANVDNCRVRVYSYDGTVDTRSIIDNMGDPGSFIAGLLWDLGLVALVASAICICIYKEKVKTNPEMAKIFKTSEERKQKKALKREAEIKKLENLSEDEILLGLSTSQAAFFIGTIAITLTFIGAFIVATIEALQYGIQMIFPCLVLFVFVSLLIGLPCLYLFNKNKTISAVIERRAKTSLSLVDWKEKLAQKRKKALIVLLSIIVIVPIVTLGIASRSITSSKSSTISDSYGNSKYLAITNAERVVESQLKVPSSATFSNVSAKLSTNNKWIISGYVEAQNSFGAKVKNSFTVELTAHGKNSFVTNSCIIN